MIMASKLNPLSIYGVFIIILPLKTNQILLNKVMQINVFESKGMLLFSLKGLH